LHFREAFALASSLRCVPPGRRFGAGDRDTVGLFVIGLPALAIGTWAGLKTFGKLDDAAFRRVVLGLLLLSGLSLLLLGR
jgi:uncharacterized membrane protein YfcA